MKTLLSIIALALWIIAGGVMFACYEGYKAEYAAENQIIHLLPSPDDGTRG